MVQTLGVLQEAPGSVLAHAAALVIREVSQQVEDLSVSPFLSDILPFK